MACTVDLRCLDEGFGGKTYKRKRESQEQAAAEAMAGEASMDIDGGDLITPPSAKRSAVASTENPDKPMSVAVGRPTYDGVIAGKVSGRPWKQPRTHRSSGRFVRNKGPDLEEMKRQKEIKRAYKERMYELKEEIRSNKVEKRKKREEREKRKKENVLRTGTKLQKITNPKTLKKIAKSKQRKHLKVIPDEVMNGNKKTIKN
uniref:Coiled-coil domain-containing protein 86 n=1 Tax=Noccaea caerulescens TaxID=107243 RepID=A0A1J3D696_NOCCA